MGVFRESGTVYCGVTWGYLEGRVSAMKDELEVFGGEEWMH